MIEAIKSLMRKTDSRHIEKNAVEAYDIWSESYDIQPGNLMLDLDEVIFTGLLEKLDLKNKTIADIGCGTGRHWSKLYQKNPSLILGFDVSSGMLNQLRMKYPESQTYQTSDNLLQQIPNESIDCLISTLTIAHIKDIEEAILSWSRVLKPNGVMVITDFHPETLMRGGKRSFSHEGKTLSVLNYVHSLKKISGIAAKYSLIIERQVEKSIGEDLRHYYLSQNALSVYDRFKGLPIIFGILLKKQSGN